MTPDTVVATPTSTHAEVAEELHYAPLPEELKAKALEKVNSIH